MIGKICPPQWCSFKVTLRWQQKIFPRTNTAYDINITDLQFVMATYSICNLLSYLKAILKGGKISAAFKNTFSKDFRNTLQTYVLLSTQNYRHWCQSYAKSTVLQNQQFQISNCSTGVKWKSSITYWQLQEEHRTSWTRIIIRKGSVLFRPFLRGNYRFETEKDGP